MWALLALIAGGLLLYSALTAQGGVPDPTRAEPPEPRRRGAEQRGPLASFASGLFQAILVFAAMIASFLGTNTVKHRPVWLGFLIGIGAWVATWFFVPSGSSAYSAVPGLDVQAATGLLAVLGAAAW